VKFPNSANFRILQLNKKVERRPSKIPRYSFSQSDDYPRGYNTNCRLMVDQRQLEFPCPGKIIDARQVVSLGRISCPFCLFSWDFRFIIDDFLLWMARSVRTSCPRWMSCNILPSLGLGIIKVQEPGISIRRQGACTTHSLFY
jgi:hypothetical protein